MYFYEAIRAYFLAAAIFFAGGWLGVIWKRSEPAHPRPGSSTKLGGGLAGAKTGM